MGDWHPWSELASRRHLVLLMEELPATSGGGVYVPHPSGNAAVVLDPRLNQVERRCVLTHELVHDEDGGGFDAEFMPRTWKPRVVINEQQTDDEAVDRLVPYSELLRFVVELEMGCIHPEPGHVAEEFHVTERVAQRAMELLNMRLDEAMARFNAKRAEESAHAQS